MANSVPPIQSPERPLPVPPEEQKSEEELAMEQVKQLQMEQVERGGVAPGALGKPGTSQPPPKQVQDPQRAQAQTQDLAQVFSQLTSAGYKPSSRALQNSANKAHSGDVDLSATWLANLFIKVLRANGR